MLKAAKGADVILFGELHDNPICHWLQFELSKDLISMNPVFGAEMFESDNQMQVDSFLSGLLDSKQFEAACRLWPNYKTDYKPLLLLAKEHKRPFIASNIPRKYASQVYRKGLESLDTLPAEERAWIAPLPIQYDSTLACYAAIFEMAGGHGGQNLPKAQAIKDATMAHFILKHLAAGKPFIHFNGTYHSDNYQSIYWYLKQARPDLKIVTISSTMQADPSPMDKENRSAGDFILVIRESMTRTY